MTVWQMTDWNLAIINFIIYICDFPTMTCQKAVSEKSIFVHISLSLLAVSWVNIWLGCKLSLIKMWNKMLHFFNFWFHIYLNLLLIKDIVKNSVLLALHWPYFKCIHRHHRLLGNCADACYPSGSAWLWGNMAQGALHIPGIFIASVYSFVAFCLSVFVTFAAFDSANADNVFSASHTATAPVAVARDLRWVSR